MPPSVNHYLAYRTIMRGGKPMAMSYKTAEAKKYQKEFIAYVKDEVKKQGWEMSDNRFQHYYVDTTFYFPRLGMDCNNYWKVCFDAITDAENIWMDDEQACERVERIYFDSKNPRMVMKIHPVDYIGIFDNHTQLEEFESNCIQCTRYRQGKCSLLVKSKEGRVQEDVENGVCMKYKQKSN